MATPRSCPRVFRIQVALPGVSSVARTHLADSTLTLLEGDKRHKPEKWPEGLPFEEQARRSATWELGFLSQVFLLRVVYLSVQHVYSWSDKQLGFDIQIFGFSIANIRMLEMPEMPCTRRERLDDGDGVTRTISFTAKLVSAMARLAESRQSLTASMLWKRGEIGMVGTEKADLGQAFGQFPIDDASGF
ncbi:predicted protein [Chaetomium globosum CBS 148.51]|uniref:Uncharacterized protein n=1 Tax=Chaetomium globosum (strain ATCC 6205 / CBS 148.51 / DSM 1962 / NBRC 6347 / NRRL 1970) TaxID=306901 RepID=Q2H8W9_CHAGB|nr:uncharacterized protein CHGG_03335 [Chaetomium globosum CBS 148.51]EAQ91400.1 predicted protein [Chaetomium globosum CBS 148.51]